MQAAGLPALQSGEPGQVRKEAATAGLCRCRGLGSPLILFTDELSSTCPQMAAAGLRQPGGARARRPGIAARARAKPAASRVPVRGRARGGGKTTLARILAKCLNCETGVTPQPCGKCTACVEIDAGRFVDLLEVCGAPHTRVEETRPRV